MNTEVIPIREHSGKKVASLRDLHAFLQVNRDFTNWAKQMFEYGFTENEDYAEVYADSGENRSGGRPRRDWVVTMDMGKEISMIQRTERGKQARRYFIEAEKQSAMDLTTLDGISAILDAGKAALTRAIEAEKRADKAESTVRVITAQDGITCSEYHKHYFPDMPANEFFEALYASGLLIDQRGTRGRGSNGRKKNGKQHQHPSYKGKSYFYLHGSLDKDKIRREHTRVRPGEPERALARLLLVKGLPLNPALESHIISKEIAA